MCNHNEYYVLCNRDSMNHVMKGNIGLFIQQAYRVVANNLIIEKLIIKVDLIELIKIADTDLQKIMGKIIKHTIDCNSLTHTQYILSFINYYKGNFLIEHLEIFIRKLKKNPNIVLNNLEQKLIQNNISLHNPHKSITNLFIQLDSSQ